MNADVLQQMLDTTRATAERLDEQFRIFEIDTSNGDRQQTAERVADIVLELIEEQLDERILRLPADEAATLFEHSTSIDRTAARRLMDRFVSAGQYVGRSIVESDDSAVQALPVVVVRNRSGDILRLKRRERRHDNPLHDKIVIWAGGHVRREDGRDGNPILQGAIRELQEELRLSVEERNLALLGAVWIRAGVPSKNADRTRLHVAIVFEWRAQTDDVAVALSATEFVERRGTSLSGTFVSAKDLAADIDSKQVCEPWSVEIVRRFLPDVTTRQAAPRLL